MRKKNETGRWFLLDAFSLYYSFSISFSWISRGNMDATDNGEGIY